MSITNPMDRFVTGLGPASQQFEDATDDTDILYDPVDSLEYLKGLQELQMANWAAGMGLKSKHSFLKKVITEIR